MLSKQTHDQIEKCASEYMQGLAHEGEPLVKQGIAITGTALALMALSAGLDFTVGKRGQKLAQSWKDKRLGDFAGNVGLAALNFAPGFGTLSKAKWLAKLPMLGKGIQALRGVDKASKVGKALQGAKTVGQMYDTYDTVTGLGGAAMSIAPNKQTQRLGNTLLNHNLEAHFDQKLDKRYAQSQNNPFRRPKPKLNPNAFKRLKPKLNPNAFKRQPLKTNPNMFKA